MKPSALASAFVTTSLLASLAGSAAAQTAQPTHLVVRVVSHDAKIIGTGVGGARVTVRDLDSGTELAAGVQRGGTGSTPLIIISPRERGASVFDTEGAAVFSTTLDLVSPTRVEVIAEGPLGTDQATQRASKTLLMVPGRHVEGDGLVLELHGFTVEIQAPTEASARAGSPLEVHARVTMLCGCPTEPGGLWDADRIDISATLVDAVHDRIVAEVPLAFAGETSLYRGALPQLSAGMYELRVLAVDPERANAGMATMELSVR